MCSCLPIVETCIWRLVWYAFFFGVLPSSERSSILIDTIVSIPYQVYHTFFFFSGNPLSSIYLESMMEFVLTSLIPLKRVNLVSKTSLNSLDFCINIFILLVALYLLISGIWQSQATFVFVIRPISFVTWIGRYQSSPPCAN